MRQKKEGETEGERERKRSDPLFVFSAKLTVTPLQFPRRESQCAILDGVLVRHDPARLKEYSAGLQEPTAPGKRLQPTIEAPRRTNTAYRIATPNHGDWV